jgi:hypothetical protein
MNHRIHAVLALSLVASTALAAECTATSAARRVPMLELYTSEGCDSCPPADRWVSSLRSNGYAADRVVVLAFHVDYWDRLGWPDRFAQQRFTERQRLVNDRIRSRVVYTPQLVLNGKDHRRSSSGDFAQRIAEISRMPTDAAIAATVKPAQQQWHVTGQWSGHVPDAQAWLALYENDLETDVRAGENRGKRLHHDFVVRDIAGPLPRGTFSHAFKLDPTWKGRDLSLAVFVQDARSGDVLQALAVGPCS